MVQLDIACTDFEKSDIMNDAGDFLGIASDGHIKGWLVLTRDGKMHEIGEDFSLRDHVHYAEAVTSHLVAPHLMPALILNRREHEFPSHIEVPDGILSIDRSAFSFCNSMTSISLPSTLTSIGSYAFASSGLESICIPDSVSKVGEYAFKENTSLKHVRLSKSMRFIPSSAFSHCFSLEELHVHDRIESIHSNAFAGCSLKSVTGCKSIERIEDDAFVSNAKLEHMPCLQCIRSIGNFAFAATGLESLEIGPCIETIGYGAFNVCSRLRLLKFNGKTLEQVKKMKNYPWELKDLSIIKAAR